MKGFQERPYEGKRNKFGVTAPQKFRFLLAMRTDIFLGRVLGDRLWRRLPRVLIWQSCCRWLVARDRLSFPVWRRWLPNIPRTVPDWQSSYPSRWKGDPP